MTAHHDPEHSDAIAPRRVTRVTVAPPRAVGAPRRRSAVRGVQTTRTRSTPPPAVADKLPAPTTSLRAMLVTLTTCLLLSLILDAQAIVHSGQGMPDGPKRTVTLTLGKSALWIGDTVHVAWIWRQFAAIHGYNPQPDVPPMLASNSNSNPPVVSASQTTNTPASPNAARTATIDVRRRRSQPAGARPHGAVPPIRIPTRQNPLRLLVTGDSLTEFLGPDLVNGASSTDRVHGVVDTHYGTGLVRPDFVDWSLVAHQQMATYRSEVVVVMIGGNDFQNMQMPNGRIVYANTPEWTQEYQRRVAICMRAWMQGGARRVYWLSFPPVRSDVWSRNNAQINLAIRRAATHVPGAQYLNILGPVTVRGSYADFVTVNGRQVLVREPDGIHFNATGSNIVAGEVLDVLKHTWHL